MQRVGAAPQQFPGETQYSSRRALPQLRVARCGGEPDVDIGFGASGSVPQRERQRQRQGTASAEGLEQISASPHVNTPLRLSASQGMHESSKASLSPVSSVRPRLAGIGVSHQPRGRQVSTIQFVELKAPTGQQIVDLAVEVAPAGDPLPSGVEPVLPAPH